MKKVFLLFLSLHCLVQGYAKKQLPYQDASLPVHVRVEDLLARMTIEEKIGQLKQSELSHEIENGKFKKGAMERIFGGIGSGTLASPFIYSKEVASVYNEVQHYLVEETRLGIPGLLIAETLHGHLAVGATLFPQSIGLGATWNPELIHTMAQAIALEASSVGVRQALAPVLDLSKDHRYGRVEECYGEDPFLVSRMGVAYITGMQGGMKEDLPSNHVMCMAKHFAAYSVPNGGINLGPTSIGERELRSLHLKPFEAAVKEANVRAIMPSYNEIDGIPAHKNHFLLQDVLRNEWNFDGFVFSDYEGIDMLNYFHHAAKDRKSAALQSIQAGVDLEAPSDDCYKNLKVLVEEGTLDVKVIDRSVRYVLSTKFRAGLFDNPYVNTRHVESVVNKKEHIELALKIAEESIVLLKNENNTLPLDFEHASVSICGPNADQVQFGDYSYSKRNEDGVTVLEGLKKYVDADRILYTEGCGLTSLDHSGFAKAVENAKKSDVAIVVVGGTSATLSGVGWGGGTSEVNTCGEGFDRASLGLPGVQLDLVKEIQKTGKPVVVVMVNGRGYSTPWLKENVDAIVEAWYPGEQGGNAVAHILSGEVNPSGKLAVSLPKSAGHSMTNYNFKPSGRGYYHKPGSMTKPGRDYVFSNPKPLYPFGYGLSYTSFKLDRFEVNRSLYHLPDTITVEVEVKNTGSRDGKEVVQLYVNDMVSSVTTPVMELKGFKKVSLDEGENQIVSFHIPVKALSLIDKDLKEIVEPGEFMIMVGTSAESISYKKVITVE
ncbi:glycoside hydrolase family 3 C-terminal domain-containing protein [Halosquirtibacter laminarini]|uniref:Glycoside hydrolase family 3 C-terminal domain-containing protein n=1 Tax=Halosquirtibacter laminarini TaxID=3374600 RepID=A0AC61NHZ8_9BACT|nr:glycoside hydrolase family 3 C-terminal domain-containing protein [Prolixibacteraceae bacterium]